MCRVEEGLSKDGSSVVRETMDQMTARIGGDGGAIAIDTKGKVIHPKYCKNWPYTVALTIVCAVKYHIMGYFFLYY